MAGMTSRLGPYLQRRGGGTLYVAVTIPPSLRSRFGGREKFIKSLKTDSVSQAHAMNYMNVVADLKEQIKAAKRGKLAGTGFTFGNEALQEVLGLKAHSEQAWARRDKHLAVEIADAAAQMAVEAEAKLGASAASTVRGITTGAETAIIEHIETWLAEKRFSERTKGDHRYAVRKLVGWLDGKGWAATVEVVDSRTAASFKLETLSAKGVHHKTANKLLSGLRTYWKWLISHGMADANPWLGKSLPKHEAAQDERERPFTDDEVAKLFAGGADRLMRDVMGIAALSGMRREEMFQLRVSDCAGGLFNVRRSKTNAGVRKVPIHAALAATVKARCEGKAPDDFLLHEAGSEGGWGNERSMPFTKRFSTYRRSCGVDEKVEGHRRSRVNFHSFRRWFITKADQAGLRREDIERTVGHKVQGMSLGLYSGGASVEQLRAVVERVELPEGIVTDADAPPVRVIKPKTFLRSKPLAKQKRGRKRKGDA